jgi:hypothetical protein
MIWNPRIKQALLNSTDGYFLVRRGLAKGLYIEENDEHGLRTCFGFYERELVPHLRSLIHRGDCCYDIGASGGYYTLVSGKLSQGRVFAFEPDPRRIIELNRALERNHLDATQYSVNQVFVDKATNADKQRLALDDFVQQGHPPPDFMKMDIEGAEYDALLGLRTTLRANRPRLAIETHGKDVEMRCIDLLRSLEYSVSIVDQAKFLRESRPDVHNRWLVVEPLRK